MTTLDVLCPECQGDGWVWRGNTTERQMACPTCDGTGMGGRPAEPDWFVLVDTGTPIEPDSTLVGPFFHRDAADAFIASLGEDTTATLLDAVDPDRVRVVTKGRT